MLRRCFRFCKMMLQIYLSRIGDEMFRTSLLGCSMLLIICLAVPSAWALNKVLSLDGDGDYVEAPFIPLNDRSFTIEMWIQSNLSSSQEEVLSQTQEASMNKSLGVRINNNGNIRMFFWGNDLDTSAGVISIGRWYHLAFCFDYSTEPYSRKIYVNGEQKAFDTPEFAYQGTSGNTILGAWDTGSKGQFFYGIIDEVRIWNIARTQDEIQDAMNRPLTLDEIQSENLVGYWNFDSGDARDLSQYENHGELYGDARIVDTIYVSTEGDDLTGDGTKDNPYRTIQKGIDESRRGDIVQALPGTSEENIELVSDLIVLGSGAENEGEGSIVFKPFINTLDEIIADTSGDGTISAYDAALILQYLVGLIDQFPATSPIGQAAQKYIAGEITIAELDRILQSFGYPSVFKLLGYENQLLQNYPNPFNPETWIPFKLAQDTHVTILIYDTKGQLIRTIALGNRNAGIYTTKDKAAYWDGRDSLGEKVSSGVYYYTLQAGEFMATRKMVIVK